MLYQHETTTIVTGTHLRLYVVYFSAGGGKSVCGRSYIAKSVHSILTTNLCYIDYYKSGDFYTNFGSCTIL